MEQCYQNNNLVCQQIRNTLNYQHHKFNVYEQHFGIPTDILPTCTVPPNPFNLWFPPADPYYAGLFQYNAGTVYRLDLKGQIISKRFFLAKDSSKKRTKTRRTVVKTNSFVRFLEESSA